jgi:DNA polymerase elongation subunit (family B)
MRGTMSDDLDQIADSYQSKPCRVCQKTFTPPRESGALSTDDNHKYLCPSCRRAVKDAVAGNELPSEGPVLHDGPGAPMRQVIFDLETWGLDRGWGVTLVASFLIHGDGDPKRITLKHRDSAAWKAGKRSDDHEMAEEVFRILGSCHIGYAHNGDRFDVKWLRTVALKYGLQMPRLKLVDPCQIAWSKYLLGRNSLEAVADFMGLKQSKLHISPDVWRGALMDDSDESWSLLVDRCVSDVDLLNAVARGVSGDVGMIDYRGSWR